MGPMDTVIDPESIGEDGLPIMPAPPALVLGSAGQNRGSCHRWLFVMVLSI